MNGQDWQLKWSLGYNRHQIQSALKTTPGEREEGDEVKCAGDGKYTCWPANGKAWHSINCDQEPTGQQVN